MAAVYILFSKSLKRFYIGSCFDLTSRLNEHLNKNYVTSFTAKAIDWGLFLTIENLNYQQARFVEAHIKKMKSTDYIKNLKKYPEMVSKLVEKYKLV